MVSGEASGEAGVTWARQGGFTLLGLLFLLMVLGVGLAGLGTLWDTVSRREKEAELLFVGDQYRRAIAGYYQASPGAEKQYPRRLQDLVADPRFPHTVRHLRRLYRDPLDNSPTWGLVKQGEGIVGVYSQSDKVPLKRAGFPALYASFADAASYRDWVFSGLATPGAGAEGEAGASERLAPGGAKPAAPGQPNFNPIPRF